ncbi:MAG: hypothetical protein CMH56_10065 [Myxococcales bacterium]|nr:hypothetical protein [Myxococcales bacterium]|tara:strand:+ start:609 stop:1694 length:1086 start_codon:yes stop_codon:yes gene_type:complete
MKDKKLTDLDAQFGDVHNFGRQTHQIEIEGKPFFKKHRNLLWEELLVGESSSLLPLLSRTLGESAARGAMGLRFSKEKNDHLGHVERFEGFLGIEEIPRDSLYYFNVGKQIAYFMALGITDILLENTKLHRGGIQLIDVECVLSNTIAIEESSLLPYPEDDFDGQYGLFPLIYGVKEPALFGHLALGLADGLISIAQHHQELVQELETALNSTATPPLVRVLMRATSEYDLFLRKDIMPQVPFTPCEQEQLDRGDVPYFFKHMGDHRIQYYKDAQYNTEFSTVRPSRKGFSLSQTGFYPKQIVAPPRLNFLLKRSLRSLRYWTSIGSKYPFSFASKRTTIELKEKRANITFDDYYSENFAI